MAHNQGILALGSAVAVLAGSAVSLHLLHHPEAAGAASIAAVATLIAMAAARAMQHRRLSLALRSSSTAGRFCGIGVRTGRFGEAAFVAGLRRPTVYCDQDLPHELTTRELRAVILHERAHQEARDPARLLLVGVLAPIARWLPFGRQWLAWAVAQREIAADRYAVSQGASREEIASALLRLPPLAQAHVAGFTAAIDLRLRALLGEDVATVVPLAVRRAAVLFPSALLVMISAAFLIHWQLGTALGHVCC